ncbi:hypothetical protein [Paenibacillus xylanexedens]|uniref:hypothetical protein n=1 Tax=Paenibacillus xylanexedens TaxID=528191 RepID=UPI0011A07270|nr:hypothetical protein [Paenibacillus xylanexedens]
MGLDALRVFVESGKYHALELNIKKTAILREKIRKHQTNIGVKRMEWTEQGVVGVFEGYRIYDIDVDLLKTFLADLGLLPVLYKVDWSALSSEEQERMKPWVLSQLPTIRFTTKKDSKSNINILSNFEERIGELELVQLVEEWKLQKTENDFLTTKWKNIRMNLQSELSAPCCYRLGFGTISCSGTAPLISTIDLYNQLGEDVIMKNGKVNSSLLPVYMAQGFFTKRDLKRYRKVIDIRLKYTLMQIHAEQRRREYYQDYLRKHSM